MAMETTVKNAQKLKIILLGDSGVGKTSLINRYVNNKFQTRTTYNFTEPLRKEMEVDNTHVILEIHDTGGREGEGLEAGFYSDAKGCILVYDVTNRKSLDNLQHWHNECSTRVRPNGASSGFPFIVLGNKIDIDHGGPKKDGHLEARKWYESKGLTLVMASAKENKNVDEAFKQVAKLAIKQQKTPEPPQPTRPLTNHATGNVNPTTSLNEKPSSPPQKSSSCCCVIL